MEIELSVRKKLFTATGEFTFKADLQINNGEIVSFFGPSGVGKTTMLRIIAGLTDADEGFVKVGGQFWLDTADGTNLPPRKRKVGFVFQHYALFPNMSVRENLQFAQKNVDKQHLDELLEIFGLVNLQHRKPGVLSGGQNQRVALARALARKPDLLLLDEPLSALDIEMRSSLQDEILHVHKLWGITTILVSHDLPEVFKLCNRVITFNNGRVTDDGNPYDIFANYKISGKLQFVAEVLKVEKEDVVDIHTLLIGNSPVKIAVCNNRQASFLPGDKVLVISKAFNPIIQKLNSKENGR
ncbi:MAG: ATP-binding cassette domain-containing protein [Syntrophorhabdaceae bacterium]|nr:ATP-binding cassette domain-containing protein [Syntrophorhabdaceae bacterium]